MTKLKATMVSCGAASLRAFHESAVLVTVSPQSYLQNTAEIQVERPPLRARAMTIPGQPGRGTADAPVTLSVRECPQP